MENSMSFQIQPIQLDNTTYFNLIPNESPNATRKYVHRLGSEILKKLSKVTVFIKNILEIFKNLALRVMKAISFQVHPVNLSSKKIQLKAETVNDVSLWNELPLTQVETEEEIITNQKQINIVRNSRVEKIHDSIEEILTPLQQGGKFLSLEIEFQGQDSAPINPLLKDIEANRHDPAQMLIFLDEILKLAPQKDVETRTKTNLVYRKVVNLRNSLKDIVEALEDVSIQKEWKQKVSNKIDHLTNLGRNIETFLPLMETRKHQISQTQELFKKTAEAFSFLAERVIDLASAVPFDNIEDEESPRDLIFQLKNTHPQDLVGFIKATQLLHQIISLIELRANILEIAQMNMTTLEDENSSVLVFKEKDSDIALKYKKINEQMMLFLKILQAHLKIKKDSRWAIVLDRNLAKIRKAD